MKLLLFLFILSGCASRYKVASPALQMFSPEAKGRFKKVAGSLFVHGGTRGDLRYANEKANNPMDMKRSIPGPGINGEIGLFKKLDFISYIPISSPPMLGLKYQLFGDPATTAKSGNQSFSFFALAGSNKSPKSEQESMGQKKKWGPETTFTENASKIGVMYGYRFTKKVLAFLSVAEFTHSYQSAPINMIGDKDRELDGKKFDYQTRNSELGMGVFFIRKFMTWKFEVISQKTRWTNSPDTHLAIFNFGASKEFN